MLLGPGADFSDDTLNKIRLSLAISFSNYLPQSQASARQQVGMDIALIHWSVFSEYGLLPSTFGGTPFGGKWAFSRGVSGAVGWPHWCTKCAEYQP
jgi:hypothetical protein